MTLVEMVRCIGVGIALVGAFVTAPEGTLVLVRRLRSAWFWILRHLPGYHRSVTVYPKSGAATGSFGNVAVTAHGSAWSPDAPLSEQIELLRKRTDQLSGRIEAVRNDLQGRVDEVRADLTAAVAEHRSTLAAVHDELARRDKHAAEIDAAGLPLIGAGIVLLGLPDRWVGTVAGATILLSITGMIVLLTFAPRLRRRGRA
jgi:hypothetical protein